MLVIDFLIKLHKEGSCALAASGDHSFPFQMEDDRPRHSDPTIVFPFLLSST